MKVLLVTGGSIDEKTALAFFDRWGYDRLIGVDRGAVFLYEHHLLPDFLVGDYDSLPLPVLEYFKERVPVRRFPPEKDETDTELAIREALEMGADSIAVLGGTGTRLDHVMGNIQALMIPLNKGVEAFLIDAHNKIQLISRELYIDREQRFGDFISFFSFTTQVKGLTLEGFKYPLHEFTLTKDNSLGVSNEIVEETAHVTIDSGVLLMIESLD